jgi:hypothetical protein
MKKTVLAAAVFGLACASCVEHGSSRVGSQLIDLDAKTRIMVQVEGAIAQPGPVLYADLRGANGGAPIHRELQGLDGKALFAYDLTIRKSAPAGNFRFQLNPAAGNTPTFAKTREVALTPQDDTVRVVLMEQPATGKKIVDVFHVLERRPNSEDTPMTFQSHLMALHNRFFKWVHGD